MDQLTSLQLGVIQNLLYAEKISRNCETLAAAPIFRDDKSGNDDQQGPRERKNVYPVTQLVYRNDEHDYPSHQDIIRPTRFELPQNDKAEKRTDAEDSRNQPSRYE